MPTMRRSRSHERQEQCWQLETLPCLYCLELVQLQCLLHQPGGLTFISQCVALVKICASLRSSTSKPNHSRDTEMGIKETNVLETDLWMRRKREPRGMNWVTMQRLGGRVQAPMNRITLGCFSRFMMETSRPRPSAQLKRASPPASPTTNPKV